MGDGTLPRIAGLSGAELALVTTVAMHSPGSAGAGSLTWTLTVLTADGVPLAESRVTSPDYPVPLAAIVQPHLDVVGLEARGPWRTEATSDGVPRFSVPVRLRPDR